jgi:hypothetical protein
MLNAESMELTVTPIKHGTAYATHNCHTRLLQ